VGKRILLKEQKAAEWLDLAVKTLQKWRVQGGGPKFIKLGRSVRYTEEDLEEYIQTHRVPHTAAIDKQAHPTEKAVGHGT
jgi:predicted DNA-binding transcriptional regulator AlpA